MTNAKKPRKRTAPATPDLRDVDAAKVAVVRWRDV